MLVGLNGTEGVQKLADKHGESPFVLLTREIFASREQILLHLYAATGVSCRTVDRSAVRSAVIAFRPDGVRW